MANLSKGAMEAGNRNTVGKDTQVFRQIAYEGRIRGRKDRNELESLRKLSCQLADSIGTDATTAWLNFSVVPLVASYWNEASVRLFHDLAQHDISWDATGKIVRSTLSTKKLLY